MYTRRLILLILTALVLLAVSCTAGPNVLAQPVTANKPAGFILGLWHGFISLFTFILSLFSKKINVYEVYNNGGWYNFGFILGIAAFYGGGGSGAKRKRRE